MMCFSVDKQIGTSGYFPNPPTMKRFEEKSVLITGASRGIGKGIAKRFADEGANLILASNEEAIHQVAKEFKASGVNAISFGLRCDTKV